MPVPYIPEYKGEPFDFFDALGLVPKASYTEHDIEKAWRTAFKILHSDRAPINGEYVPTFPTVHHITKAKDWLLARPENIEIAFERLAESYQSTWNPHAKAGTPSILQPIPGAVADVPTRRARRPFQNIEAYFESDETANETVYSLPRAATAAEHRNARHAREAARPVYPSAADQDHRPWRVRRKEQNARPREEEFDCTCGPEASEIIDNICDDNLDLEPFLRSHNVRIR